MGHKMNLGTCDFSNAKAGDKVFDILFGIGKIKEINDDVNTPIVVEFIHYNGPFNRCYDNAGRLDENSLIPTLYYREFEIKIPDEAYSQPIPEIDASHLMINS